MTDMQKKVQVSSLSVELSSKMASIASKAHFYPMSLSTIESCFAPLYSSFGVYIEGKLQGFAISHQIFEDATLMDICIEPESQGLGLGCLLLDNVITSAREKGAETLFLEVRESGVAARGLYIKNGFVETGCRKGYYKTADGTEDAILMALTFSR